jgi:hypothetical protein
MHFGEEWGRTPSAPLRKKRRPKVSSQGTEERSEIQDLRHWWWEALTDVGEKDAGAFLSTIFL